MSLFLSELQSNFYLVLKAVIFTLLLPIVTVNTWLFTAISAGFLFVGFCVNQPLLYILGRLRGPR